MEMSRRDFARLVFGGAMATAGSLAVPRWARAQSLKEVVIAEPLHGIGYLPMYVSAANGYFTSACGPFFYDDTALPGLAGQFITAMVELPPRRNEVVVYGGHGGYFWRSGF